MSRESSPLEAKLVICARFIMGATIAMTMMLKSLYCAAQESFLVQRPQNPSNCRVVSEDWFRIKTGRHMSFSLPAVEAALPALRSKE